MRNYGAEVIQLTVGPEAFYLALLLLEETGYFNFPLQFFGVAGIETIGTELRAVPLAVQRIGLW